MGFEILILNSRIMNQLSNRVLTLVMGHPWREAFDTRILPGDSKTLTLARNVPQGAHSLFLWDWIDPDYFYTGFFRDRLRRGSDFPGADSLRQALDESIRRRYTLFSRTIPIIGAN